MLLHVFLVLPEHAGVPFSVIKDLLHISLYFLNYYAFTYLHMTVFRVNVQPICDICVWARVRLHMWVTELYVSDLAPLIKLLPTIKFVTKI